MLTILFAFFMSFMMLAATAHSILTDMSKSSANCEAVFRTKTFKIE